MPTKTSVEDRWIKDIKKLLLNRKIVGIRYMDKQEVEDLGWYHKAVVIELDDGTVLWPSKDDEGNDAGALFTTSKALPTIPVIR